MLVIVTFFSICVARWSAVFPLSRFLNFFYRARFEKFTNRNSLNGGISSQALPDEISHKYQMMIFWAGLRGAVGVALAMGIQGEAKWTLLATVLVVVVLTVILFGGTTASMLEILGIKIGCVDETNDSDDEFDIEAPRLPFSNPPATNNILLGNRRYNNAPNIINKIYKDDVVRSRNESTSSLPRSNRTSRSNSSNDLLSGVADEEDFLPSDADDLLPNAIPSSSSNTGLGNNSLGGVFGDSQVGTGVLGALLSAEEHTKWFTKFDEQVLKPVLLDTLPNNRRNLNREDSNNA